MRDLITELKRITAVIKTKQAEDEPHTAETLKAMDIINEIRNEGVDLPTLKELMKE